MAPLDPPAVAPGRCAVHGLELVPARRLPGVRHYGSDAAAVWCPDPGHEHDAQRCRWCGGPLWPADDARRYWERSPFRETCGDRCRLARNRAARRARGEKIGGRLPVIGDLVRVGAELYVICARLDPARLELVVARGPARRRRVYYAPDALRWDGRARAWRPRS